MYIAPCWYTLDVVLVKRDSQEYSNAESQFRTCNVTSTTSVSICCTDDTTMLSLSEVVIDAHKILA